MKIVMVASEARPFCKTGGLADVVYSLSKELVKMGEEVSVFLPFYDSIRRQISVILMMVNASRSLPSLLSSSC